MSDSSNNSLHKAKSAKNDEFYTQYHDIEKEMQAYLEYNENVFRGRTILLPCDDPDWSNFTKYFAQNFERFGIKKLISTSYAFASKGLNSTYEPSQLEKNDRRFNADKTAVKGKIYILERDTNGDSRIDLNDLEWDYLEGDGDFRSVEVTNLRDEADFIITNPPFSLFREFLSWVVEANKKFALISNKNAITYKEVFPLVQENKLWAGVTSFSKDMLFIPHEKIDPIALPSSATRIVDGVTYLRSPSIWLSNIEHGRRHQPLQLMNAADNLRFNNKLIKRFEQLSSKGAYPKYDNYDAIEVPFTDAIPSDYDGVMGVPISFLDKYCPEQFEILGATQRGCHDKVPDTKKYNDYWEVRQNGEKTGSSGNKTNENANIATNDGKKNYFINAEGHVVQSAYQRIFIRHINPAKV